MLRRALIAIVGLLAASAAFATGPVVTFTWTAPTANTDGSALAASDIAFYTLTCDGAVYAKPSGNLTKFVDTSKPFAVGSHSCFITVTNTSGVESMMSNTVSFIVPAPPNPPTNLTAQ